MKSRLPIATAASLIGILMLAGCSAPVVVAPTPTESEAAPVEPDKPAENTDSTDIPEGFKFILDDSGVVSVNVPSTWTDVDGASIPGPKGTTLENLAASPSIDGFINGWDTPGMSVSSSTDSSLTIQDFVDSLLTSTGSQCEDGETGDYDDGVYVGTYLYFPSCGGTTTDFLAVIAHDSDGVLVATTIQMVSDEDKTTVRDEILSSFYAIY